MVRPPAVPQVPAAQPATATPSGARASARAFIQVISRMEPAVERECQQRRTQPINCDFQFVVDDRAGLEPNAYQTIDSTGRPIIGFTLSLIGEARNADELAFVVGHEASHHILGHINRKSNAATMGAVILGGLASAYGGSTESIKTAQDFGAQFGARFYSKDWELEADYLGAIIALNAGLPLDKAFLADLVYWPGDIIKNIAASFVALAVHRAFPGLLVHPSVPLDQSLEAVRS